MLMAERKALAAKCRSGITSQSIAQVCSVLGFFNAIPSWCTARQTSSLPMYASLQELNGIALQPPAEYALVEIIGMTSSALSDAVDSLRAVRRKQEYRALAEKHTNTIKQLAQKYRDLELRSSDLMSEHAAIAGSIARGIRRLAEQLATQTPSAVQEVKLILNRIDRMINNVKTLRSELVEVTAEVKDEQYMLQDDAEEVKKLIELDEADKDGAHNRAAWGVVLAPFTGGLSLVATFLAVVKHETAKLSAQEGNRTFTSLLDLNEGLDLVVEALEQRADQYKQVLHNLYDAKEATLDVEALGMQPGEEPTWDQVDAIAAASEESFEKLSDAYTNFVHGDKTRLKALADKQLPRLTAGEL